MRFNLWEGGQFGIYVGDDEIFFGGYADWEEEHKARREKDEDAKVLCEEIMSNLRDVVSDINKGDTFEKMPFDKEFTVYGESEDCGKQEFVSITKG